MKQNILKKIIVINGLAAWCIWPAYAEEQLFEKIYDGPGAYEWVVPAGVNEVELTLIGGGGSGGRGGHYEIWSEPQRKVLHVQVSHEHNRRADIDQNWSQIEHIKGPARVKMSGGSCGDSEWIANHSHNPHGRRRTDGSGIPYGQYHHLPAPGHWEEWRSGEDRMFGIAVGGPGFRWDGCDQNLDVQYLDEFTALGLNGASGAKLYSQMVVGLQSGDVLTFTVGAGGRNGKGGGTYVTRHDATGQPQSLLLKDGRVVETLVANGGERGRDGREKVRMLTELEPIPTAHGAGGYGAQNLGIDGGEGQPGYIKFKYVQDVINRQQLQQSQWQAYLLTRLVGEYTREIAMDVQHANEALDTCVKLACQEDPELTQALRDIEVLRTTTQTSREQLNQAVAHFETLLFRSLSTRPALFQPLIENHNNPRLTEL